MINFNKFNKMEIVKGAEIVDLALFFKKQRALVIADVHIGFEEALNKQGILVPRFQFKEVIQKLEKIVNKAKPKTIIINGDVKHEFGSISEQEWRETLKVLDFLAKQCKKMILVRGNHDTILGPIAKKRGIEIADYFVIGSTYVTHGHKIPNDINFSNAKTIISAHEHPAVSIHDYPKSELFKCYLKGKWKSKTLIVMPSFNLVTEGTDILKEQLLSPFLQTNLDDFEVFVVEDKVYRFGKLRNLRK
jgi:hypothetical protein